MKLMTLNIWGGHIRDPLLEFIKAHRKIDIFCFQEVYHKAQEKISTEDRENSLNIFEELQNILLDHHAFFKPVVNHVYGIGMFIRKDVEVLDEGDILIHENPNYSGSGPTHSRNLQWIKCRFNHQIYSISNVHGLWNGNGKTDSPERIAQSQRIMSFLDNLSTPKIVCGDFNLRPDTVSIKMLENGMTNLIKAYNVHSTRTRLYSKEEKFADYIFTSPDIAINQFETLEDEVSDHKPLLLDFH